MSRLFNEKEYNPDNEEEVLCLIKKGKEKERLIVAVYEDGGVLYDCSKWIIEDKDIKDGKISEGWYELKDFKEKKLKKFFDNSYTWKKNILSWSYIKMEKNNV